MASNTDPRLVKHTALVKATQLESRLDSLVNSSASDISPATVYLPGGVQQEVITGTGTVGGTWTCPEGINSVQVECWAAGGGGDGGSSTAGGQGGGGGEYAGEDAYAVIPGNIYTYAVGTPGQGGVCGGTGGTAGGNTVFDATGNGVTGHGGSPGGQGASFNGGTGSANTRHSDGGAGGISQTGIGSDTPVSVSHVLVWWPSDDVSASGVSAGLSSGALSKLRDASGHARHGRPTLVDNHNGGIYSRLAAPLQSPTKTTADVSNYGTSAYLFQEVPSPGVAIQSPTFGLGNGVASPNDGSALTVSIWAKGDESTGSWAFGNRLGYTFGTLATNCDYVNGVVNGFASSTTGGFALFLRNRAPGFYLSQNSTKSAAIFSSSALPVPDGTWHQIVGTWDGTTMKLYVDGAVAASATPALTHFSQGPSLITVGANPYTQTDSFLTGNISNFWMSASAVSGAFVAQAYGSGSVLGGSGGGASGGSGGAGNAGASATGSVGSGGGASASGADSAHGGSGAGGTGANQGGFGSNGSNVQPYGGGGGGAGQVTSPSTVTRSTFTAQQSASYCGLDAAGGNNGVLYDISDIPQAGIASVNPAVSQLSEKMYAGGSPGSSFNGSMNSIAVFPDLVSALVDQLVNTVTATITVQSPGASVLPVGIALCGAAPPSLAGDADISSYLAGYTLVNQVVIPAGPAGRQVTVDVTGTVVNSILATGALCVVLGGLQGSATYGISEGSWDSAEAYAWNTVITGANSGDPSADLALTVEYYPAGANTVGGDGAPGLLILTYADERSYPVAAMHPAAVTDANGNAFAAGYTTDSIVGFDPTVTTPGARIPAAWKTLGALASGSGFAVDTARYRYAPDDGGTLVVQVALNTASGGQYVANGYNFTATLPAAMQPSVSATASQDFINTPLQQSTGAVAGVVRIAGKNAITPGVVSVQIPGTIGTITTTSSQFHAIIRVPLT